MTPSACTLTLVNTEGKPKVMTPAFTACYTDDDAMDQLEGADVVRLEIHPLTKARSEVRLITVSDSDKHPKVVTTPYSLTAGGADSFYDHVTECQQFLWIVSTPSYEGRALIDASTNTILTKQIVERTLH
jgi:hypothetical protein